MQKLGASLSHWAEKFIPDPFIFALMLTLLTMILSAFFTHHSAFSIIGFWYRGFWDLLAFGMQMSLILITGYALATAPVMKKFVDVLAGFPKNTASAAMLIALVAVLTGYLNWGLAIVVAPLLARETARQAQKAGRRFHYPLLGAAAYMGLAVWHGGFSGSAPLTVATAGHFLADQIGVIPVSQTLFAPVNLIAALVLIPGIPLLFKILAPAAGGKVVSIDEVDPGWDLSGRPDSAPAENSPSLAFKLENSRILSLTMAILAFGFIVYYFFHNGLRLNLNIVNFSFLFAGILLHQTPKNYLRAVSEGVKGAAGIILQFPFYAGIMGVMKFSGLITLFTHFITSIASPTTYPLLTFLSASVVNIFVPSGGGQWAVQGPVVAAAAKQMGVPVAKAVMAFAYGDQWTNLFQPFWALVLLGITRLKASQIMGYCMAVMLVGFLFFAVILLLPL